MKHRIGVKMNSIMGPRIDEGINYICDAVRQAKRDQVRMVIFGQGRSGSTLLESLIASTGHFVKYGELLDVAKGEIRYPCRYIRGLSRRRGYENIVFHVKVYQLTRDRKRPTDPKKLLGELYNDGWKIIYLRRRNKVKHALSNFVVRGRGAYHKLDDKEEDIHISIDCNELVHNVTERLKFEDIERDALARVQYHEVVYEDDLEKQDCHQVTVNRILDYVGLENREVATKHRKINTKSLEDLIVNYDEFVACLKAQNWEQYLK